MSGGTHSGRLLLYSHICALVAAVALLCLFTAEALEHMSLAITARGVAADIAICAVFLADLGVQMSRDTLDRRRTALYVIYIVLCLPWGILGLAVPDMNAGVLLVLRLLPVLRAVAVVAAMLRWFKAAPATSMLGAYVFFTAALLYVSTMVFYISEWGVNPLVHSYRSAFYWGVMAITTTGCDIGEYTAAGKTLASVLSFAGLVMLPVFTLYIVQTVRRGGQS